MTKQVTKDVLEKMLKSAQEEAAVARNDLSRAERDLNHKSRECANLQDKNQQLREDLARMSGYLDRLLENEEASVVEPADPYYSANTPSRPHKGPRLSYGSYKDRLGDPEIPF